jgi:hypothetical protein
MKAKLEPKELRRIANLVSVENGNIYSLWGYTLNLKTGEFRDLFSENEVSEFETRVLTILLSHYSSSDTAPKVGKLIKYGDLPGGYAYEKAFLLRAVQPIVDAFGETPTDLIRAAKLLGGNALEVGDAAVEVPALHGIPLVYILWVKSELPASATILYDESASNCLPTEDLAVLAELTTSRLLKAQLKITANK